MLLIIVMSLIFLAGMVIIICNNKFFCTYDLEMIGYIVTIGSGIIYAIVIFILIIDNCVAPYSQGKYEERYNRLMNKVKHIDSFNKEEVIEEVNNWNIDYRTNTYGKTSPWVNWFYIIDTSTTKLIELKEF